MFTNIMADRKDHPRMRGEDTPDSLPMWIDGDHPRMRGED